MSESLDTRAADCFQNLDISQFTSGQPGLGSQDANLGKSIHKEASLVLGS